MFGISSDVPFNPLGWTPVIERNRDFAICGAERAAGTGTSRRC
jgi:hypothetical protein